MQQRVKRVLTDTISYIEMLPQGPFQNEAVQCAIRDLMDYSRYIDVNERQAYLTKLADAMKSLGTDIANPVHGGLLSQLRDETRKLTSVVCVDFIILRVSHWGAVKPLVDAFRMAGCKTRIIPVPMLQERQDRWGKALQELIIADGYECIDFTQYDIEEELPDIVIDNMAVDCAKIPEFRFLRISAVVEQTVHVEHSILTGYTEAMKRSYFRIGRSRCWLYLVPSALFAKAFPLILRIDGDFVVAGCAEMDTIHALKNRTHTVPSPFKQSVLWNIDALDPDKEVAGDFERLQRELYYLREMANRFPQVLSIVRTHPNFQNQERCMQLQKELNAIVSQNSNVIVDVNPQIYDSYCAADAMVTWMSSTTLFSFAATGKPVIVIPTFIDQGYDTMLDMHLLSVIPIAYNEKDMELFFRGIGSNEERAKRLQVLTEYTGPVDGSASDKIAQEVLLRYDKLFD